VLCFLVMICCAVTDGAAQHYTLQHEDVLADVAVSDVNGDGRDDICALSARGTADRGTYLSVYLSRPDGTYAEKADCRQELPPTVGGVFFAETDGAPPAEVVAVDTAGAHILALRDKAFTQVAEPRFVSLFPAGLEFPRFLDNQVVDVDRDGVHEWLVPLPHGYGLREPGCEIATIGCHVAGAVAHDSASRTHLRYDFPGVVPFPWENDAYQALAFINTHTVEFVRGPDWNDLVTSEIPFKKAPERLSPTPSGAYADTFPKPPKPQAHAELHDLNEDGLPDLLVTEAQGSIDVETCTRIFFAQPGCTFSQEPDMQFVKSGAFAQPTVIDVNGDGLDDVFFFELSFGLKSMVSYLVRERLTLRLEAHLNSPHGFDATPRYRSRFTLAAPDGTREGILALGDFTGDGRMDAVFSPDGKRLGLFEGRGEELVSQEPSATFDIPPYGAAKTCDLNANRRRDIVVFEAGNKGTRDIHVLVF